MSLTTQQIVNSHTVYLYLYYVVMVALCCDGGCSLQLILLGRALLIAYQQVYRLRICFHVLSNLVPGRHYDYHKQC